MSSRPLTIGTAGHIDHGKTAVVEALTGKHTDRLPEERRRGISIELGYAQLELNNCALSLIDVPGHERFMKTMIAGATGIDLFLLVVDARDGVMPQTKEHMLVLRSLDVTDGVCAVTKCDVAEPAEIHDTISEVKDLVPNIPVVETSAITGAGIEELRATLGVIAETVAGRELVDEAGRAPVLHVDRVFTLKGHGMVVTGTLWSGRLREGQRVVIEPGCRKARVRSIQVHDRPVTVADPRQRVAVNLVGIKRDQVSRGNLVTADNSEASASYRVDVALTPKGLATALDDKRVQVHHGTRDAPARLVDLNDDGLVQLRLESQLLVREGDRVVLRGISDQQTLGGGQIKDTSPVRRGPNSSANKQPVATGDPVGRDRRPASVNAKDVGETTTKPTDPLTDPVSPHALLLITEAGLRPPRIEEITERLDIDPDRTAAILEGLSTAGKVVKLTDGLYVEAGALVAAIERIVERGDETGSIRLADIRDLLGIGRHGTQLILEHCDRQRVTLRRGDLRHLRRARR